MANDLLEKISGLPVEIIDHVYSIIRSERLQNLFSKHNIDIEGSEKLQELVWSVYLKEITIDDFINKVLELHGKDGEKIAGEYIGIDFLEFKDHLGVQPEIYLQKLGLDPRSFRESINEEDVVNEITKDLHSESLLPKDEKKLSNILMSLVTGVRNISQTHEVLIRSQKVGG